MKKLFLSLAMVAALTLGACGTSANDEKHDATEIVTAINGSTSVDEAGKIIKDASGYIEKLVKEGKIEEAQNYYETIRPVIEKKFPDLVTMLDQASAALKAGEAKEAVDEAKEKADSVAEEAKEKADSLAQDAKDKAKDAVDDAKDKAKDAVNAAANTAKDAANAAKDKANDAIKKLGN